MNVPSSPPPNTHTNTTTLMVMGLMLYALPRVWRIVRDLRWAGGPTPMNHSNKDKQSSAQSGEGRPRLKENAHSSDTHPTQSGTPRVPPVREVRTSLTLGRHLSERRTGC